MQKDALGGAAKNEFSDPRMTVRPHDQQIGLVLGVVVLEDVSDRVPVGLDVLRNHFDAGSRKVLRQPTSRLPPNAVLPVRAKRPRTASGERSYLRISAYGEARKHNT